MDFAPILALMERAARKAGASLLHDFAHLNELTIDSKGPGDFVSQADRKAEEIIVDMLIAAKPDWGVLGEEGGASTGSDARYRWIIDPLDGTENFLHHLPFWAVTIALEEDDRIIAGVTFDALHDEMFSAAQDHGCMLNGKPITVSRKKDIDEALIFVDAGLNDPAHISRYTNAFAAIEESASTSSRLMGSAALDLAYLAAGRIDGCFLQGGLKPWDVAAGILLIREAGGLVTDLALQPAHHMIGEMLAANAVLHPKLAQLIGLH